MRRRYRPDNPAYVPVREKVKAAYKLLRKLGYECHSKFWCCQSCGCAALKEGTKKYVFWHKQDDEALKECGTLFLAWTGDALEIEKALREAGLLVHWAGSDNYRFEVTADPKIARNWYI